MYDVYARLIRRHRFVLVLSSMLTASLTLSGIPVLRILNYLNQIFKCSLPCCAFKYSNHKLANL